MAEHGLGSDSRVLGVAFDGTGYGDDGAVWGGEVLVAGYADFVRAAHLAYVPLPGGDAAVRNPCRMALSHLRAAGLAWDPGLPCVRACSEQELALLDRQLTTGLRCVPTSSMGRLFDAVASLAGICHRAGYDAQAAMELEAVARRATAPRGYRFAVDGELLDAGPVLAEAAADVLAGAPASLVAARFQQGVVDLVAAVLERLRDETGLAVVTLSGGCLPQRLPHLGLRERPHRARLRGAAPPHRPGERRRPRPRAGRRARPPHPSTRRTPRKGAAMCLAVPGRVLEISERDGTRIAQVDFGGVSKEVCLEYVPDLQVGEYTIVHVGFALQRLDEQSALETLDLFRQMGELDAEFGDQWGRAADQAGLPRPDLAPSMDTVDSPAGPGGEAGRR